MKRKTKGHNGLVTIVLKFDLSRLGASMGTSGDVTPLLEYRIFENKRSAVNWAINDSGRNWPWSAWPLARCINRLADLGNLGYQIKEVRVEV